MQNLQFILSRLSISPTVSRCLEDATSKHARRIVSKSILESVCLSTKSRTLSAKSSGGSEGTWDKEWDISGSAKQEGGNKVPESTSNLGWDTSSSWSSGLTREHFDGDVVGRQVTTHTGDVVSISPAEIDAMSNLEKQIQEENRRSKAYVDSWPNRMKEISTLLKQVREPGARGSYLKDSEKAEMYRLHKVNPEVYTVEKLAKDYRIMRQRVHAILWLKELEEEEEKKHGPLDDSVELLLDSFPEFFISHDREFHVASLRYKPEFKVMPEDWDGTARDPDEVHYEISMKEDQMLYEEFVTRMTFNKKKMAGEIKWHRYSRRRPSEGWKFTVEKLGPCGKRGNGGGWKFVSLPDGSSRPLNELERLYVKRETPRRRRKIIPPW